MNKTEIEEAFKNFESKYNLPPVFQMSDGKILGAFIITKNGESFMITFESSDDDILEAAGMIRTIRKKPPKISGHSRHIVPFPLRPCPRRICFNNGQAGFPAFSFAGSIPYGCRFFRKS